jgi:hypothetical protein
VHIDNNISRHDERNQTTTIFGRQLLSATENKPTQW